MRHNGQRHDRNPEELLLPNSTQIPDTMLDLWMGLFRGEAPFKILMYIARRTFGFRKTSDNLSIPQICTGIVTEEGKRLDWGTQLGRRTVEVTLADLVARGIVRRRVNHHQSGQQAPNTYSLNLAWVPDWEPGQTPPPLPKVPESGFGDPPQDLRTHPEPRFGDPPESGFGVMCLGSPNQDSGTTPSGTTHRESSSSSRGHAQDPSLPLCCVLPDAAAAAAALLPQAAPDPTPTPAFALGLSAGAQRLRAVFPAMPVPIAMELAERCDLDGIERWIVRAHQIANAEGVPVSSKARLLIGRIRAGDPPPDVPPPESGSKGGEAGTAPAVNPKQAAIEAGWRQKAQDTRENIRRNLRPASDPEALAREAAEAKAELEAFKWVRRRPAS